MRLVNAILVLVTALGAAGGYLQEKKRLGIVRGMPAPEARAMFEAAQKRRDRVMVVVTGALVAGAAAAILTRVWS